MSSMNVEARKRLIALLATADENFLIAIANKGLLRRAYKDLEEFTPLIEETDREIIVRGPDWTVWMPPEGPTKARDDTKATGITRQILAATIYLRDYWHSGICESASELSIHEPAKIYEGSAPKQSIENIKDTYRSKNEHSAGKSIKQALLEINFETLSKWAGKKLLDEALDHCNSLLDLEVNEQIGLILRSDQHEIEVRVLPTTKKGIGLLEEVLSTAPKTLHKRWVLSAILALKHKEGAALAAPSSIQKTDVESPRTRTQILQDTFTALSKMLTTGIAHPSQRMVERLATLSMSASAVHLPRLAHMLRSLAEDVSLMIDRDTNADSHRLFASMCRISALVRALEAVAPDVPLELAGAARSQYKKLGTLALTGVGAYPWQTSSGYTGLTVLFWNVDKQRFFSWSASRPAQSLRGFDESQVYRLESPWSGSKSPEKICRSSFTLSNASANIQGRLSGSAETIAFSGDSNLTPNQIVFGDRLFSNWSKLSKYAASQFPTGLKLLNPLDLIVVVEPKIWGERFFDDMQQALCWKLEDVSATPVLMTLPWNETNERAIHFFEALKPEKEAIEKLVVRINFDGSGFTLQPISLITGGTQNGEYLLNPFFDHQLIESKQSNLINKLRQKFKRDIIQTRMTGDDEWDEILHITSLNPKVPFAIKNTLAETEGLLLQIAESGINGSIARKDDRIGQLSASLTHCGLGELAKSLKTVSEAEATSESVLWSGYLCNLHWQVMTQLTL